MGSTDNRFKGADGIDTVVFPQPLLKHLKGNIIQVMDAIVECITAALARHATTHINGLETGPRQT